MTTELYRKVNYQVLTDKNNYVTSCIAECEVVFFDGEKETSEKFQREIGLDDLRDALSKLCLSADLVEKQKTKKCFVYEDKEGYCHILFPKENYKDTPTDLDITGFYNSHLSGVSEFFVTEMSKIPQDKTFRDAWKKGDINEPIKIDFHKAIQIHRTRLQEACKRKIAQLDSELERALEDDNLPLQVACRKTKKILRTLHEMDLTHCKTLEDIKNSIPKELHDVWNFYPPGKI